MACCTLEGTDKMFSRQSRYFAKKFRRKGLDRAQRCIVEEIEKIGIKGRSVLEIGCGVGGLHLTLLKKGASSAFGVEASGGMIAKATELAAELGVSARVAYLQGDFASLNGEVPSADIVVLDKVLCCYPDPESLIVRSVAKARTAYVVSYPRDALLARIGFTSMEKLGILLRWSFHPFYHEPSELERLVQQQGMKAVASQTSPIWQVSIFRREEKIEG